MAYKTDRCELDLSVVIPVYNEVENVEMLYHALENVLDRLNKSYEVILIDDGSSDGTYSKLKEVHEKNHKFKVIRFRRNFGQTAAMSAGFDYAKGETVLTIDADLQNDPNEIPLLIEEIDKGYDVVSGWRKNRRDNVIIRTIPSRAANWLISRLTGIRLHDFGCTLKAYRHDVIKNIELYGDMHRYIPALASRIGIKVTEVPVSHQKRVHGRSKYGLSRILKVIIDIVTLKFLLTYSTKPLQIFGLLGIISFILGFLVSLYLTIERLVFGQPLANRPLLLLGILLLFLGLQFFSIGLIGEMIMRTYHESQNKPIYFIKDILD